MKARPQSNRLQNEVKTPAKPQNPPKKKGKKGTRIEDRLMERYRKSQEQINQKRNQKQAKERLEFTGAPSINAHSRKLAEAQSSDNDRYLTFSTMPPSFVKLSPEQQQQYQKSVHIMTYRTHMARSKGVSPICHVDLETKTYTNVYVPIRIHSTPESKYEHINQVVSPNRQANKQQGDEIDPYLQISPYDLDFAARNDQLLKKRETKYQKYQDYKQKEMMSECSFQPKISHIASPKVSKNSGPSNAPHSYLNNYISKTTGQFGHSHANLPAKKPKVMKQSKSTFMLSLTPAKRKIGFQSGANLDRIEHQIQSQTRVLSQISDEVQVDSQNEAMIADTISISITPDLENIESPTIKIEAIETEEAGTDDNEQEVAVSALPDLEQEDEGISEIFGNEISKISDVRQTRELSFEQENRQLNLEGVPSFIEDDHPETPTLGSQSLVLTFQESPNIRPQAESPIYEDSEIMQTDQSIDEQSTNILQPSNQLEEALTEISPPTMEASELTLNNQMTPEISIEIPEIGVSNEEERMFTQEQDSVGSEARLQIGTMELNNGQAPEASIEVPEEVQVDSVDKLPTESEDEELEKSNHEEASVDKLELQSKW